MARTQGGAPTGPRRPASQRATSGAGFEFEDLVAAWFMTRALAGEPAPGLSTPPASIHFQTRPSGWFVDDLLVTATDGARLAVSCKSNVQVTRNGLPPDFVGDVQAQWAATGPFDPARDSLMLVTQGAHAAFDAAWRSLKSWSENPDDAFVLDRIAAEARPSRVFDGLTPEANRPGDRAVQLSVLRRIEHLRLDLQARHSADRDAAVARCRSALVDGDQAAAEVLWRELVDLAKAARLGHGALALDTVLSHLRTRFRLRGHPDHGAGWSALETITLDHRDRITTTLPLGLILPREDLRRQLREALSSRQAVLVFGESGIGKSALVKSVLDADRPDWRQVWVGPESLPDLLSREGRARRGVPVPLKALFDRSPTGTHVLVIDSAERLDATLTPAVQALLEDLRATVDWRVVIITQPDDLATWAGGAAAAEPPLEVGPLSAAEVRAAFYARAELTPLALDPALLEVLGNPRTLGWVIAAGQGLNAGELVSHTAVADRLWRYWTGGQPVTQGFVIRLARREADFERSFPLSRLDAADLLAFQTQPSQLPLHAGPDNRLSFDHDLVADWARFQALKEDARELSAWAPLTGHPLWVPALRLMAQHLLRLPAEGGTAWDQLLTEAEAGGESLAADLLLEALALDPQADRLLTERLDALLADDGKRLDRLLRRFHHVATVPSTLFAGLNAGVRLYLETRFRTPMVGRWLPVARFLNRNAGAIAPLMSPTVAMICETWITGTPQTWRDGEPFPLRRELAELALATAREVQAAKRSDVIFLGDGARPIFAAALKCAEDIPERVGAWALEMAERRPDDLGVSARADARRRLRQEAVEARMQTDEAFRRQELARREHRPSMMINLDIALPPWPLGASGRVDHDFRRVCLQDFGLTSLMRARPGVAAEVLLALLIEDQPKERQDRSFATDRWGLEFEGAEGPMAAPFRSPFFGFLTVNADEALGALQALVAFCTERWADHERRFEGEVPEPLEIPFGETVRCFAGDAEVFDWAGSTQMGTGQLHALLAALEKWLCMELDAGRDISPVLDRLLADGASTALIGTAINVGKYRPDLFRGPLRPLLGVDLLYVWDAHRSTMSQFQFDPVSWFRYGQEALDAARAWALAPYRKVALADIAEDLIKTDAEFADWLKARAADWPDPGDDKSRLEVDLLRARLDRSLYREGEDGALVFEAPAGLVDRLAAFQSAAAEAQERVWLAPRLADAMKDGRPISDDDAAWVASRLEAMNAEEPTADAEDAPARRANVIACAAALAALAPEWLSRRPDLERPCLEILRRAADAISVDWEVMAASGYQYDVAIELTAWGIARRWAADPEDDTWHRSLLALLVSGNGTAAGIVIAFAHQQRDRLGDIWWRLLRIALFNVALGVLPPPHGDARAAALWARRVTWLRTRSLAEATRPADLDILDLQARIGRLREIRRRRSADERAWRGPEPVRPPAFNDHLLELYFGWLVRHGEDHAEVGLLERFWRYALDRQRRRRDDDREDAYPKQFEMHVIERLAMLSVSRPDGERLWRAVLAAGPLGHQAVGRFASYLFFHVEQLDRDRFLAVWRGMIAYGLSDPAWAEEGRWYYRQGLLRQLLGLDLPNQIARLADAPAAVGEMVDLYGAWASAHLAGDEDNVAAFARFLGSAVGAALRRDGLLWLAAAARSQGGLGYWRRDEGTAEAIVEFLDGVLRDEARTLGRDKEQREALMTLIADLVKRQVAMGLVLQERMKTIG